METINQLLIEVLEAVPFVATIQDEIENVCTYMKLISLNFVSGILTIDEQKVFIQKSVGLRKRIHETFIGS